MFLGGTIENLCEIPTDFTITLNWNELYIIRSVPEWDYVLSPVSNLCHFDFLNCQMFHHIFHS